VSDARSGTSLVEVLVALVIGLVVLHLAIQGLATAKRTEADLRARSQRLATIRAARVVLREAATANAAGGGWIAHPPDSLVIRAFQGTALPCGTRGSGDGLLVGWTGRRRADPADDSVRALDARGVWNVAALVAVRPVDTMCAVGRAASVQHWELDRPMPADVVLLRLFEAASYHIADGALRYRIGGGGRQPLTPDVLARSDGGGFALEPALVVTLRGAGGEWSWRGYLAGQR